MAVHYGNRQPYYREVRRDNPIALWRLGETSGTIAVDEMGLYDGTYVGSPTLGVSGAVAGNTAVSFSSATQRMTKTTESSLRPAQCTVELWARPTSTQGTGICFISRAGGLVSSGLTIFKMNGAAQFWAASNSSTWAVQKSVALTLNAWQHLAITYDGVNVRAYKNGVEIGSPVALASLHWETTGGIRIGSDDVNMYLFDGSIDEVAIYNYALSPAQVLRHYQAATL